MTGIGRPEIQGNSVTERERRISAAIQYTRRLNDSAKAIYERLADMRNRLLGTPSKTQNENRTQAPTQSECDDLKGGLECLYNSLCEISLLVNDLEDV